MLDVLRATKGGIITWVFLGAIIFMFIVFFGPGSLVRGQGGCSGQPAYAARVNGETIPVSTFNQEFRPVAERYERDPNSASMLPYFAVQVLNGLVEETLVAQEAERRGIQVTDEELVLRVKADPGFQVEGKFNEEKYRRATTQQFGSVAAYEASMKQRLRVAKLQAAVTASIQVPEAEIHETWKTLSDTFDVSYVLFPNADALAEVKVSDADVQAFAAKEGARIEKFYKDNGARYDQPQKVRVRHILAKIQNNDDATARKRIEDAIVRLGSGQDFAKVAADVSDDVNTKSAGGDMGEITAGSVDEAFAKAAMALEPGKISGPVKTPAGWHVIKVDQVIPAKKISLDAARSDIARELLSADRAKALVKEKAEAALKAAQGGKSLADQYPQPKPAVPAAENRPEMPEVKAALTWGGKAIAEQSTGPTPASVQSLAGLEGAGDMIKDVVAAQGPGLLPRVYTTPSGAIVASVKTRLRPDEKKYAAERHGHEVSLKGQKLRQMETVWLQQLRASASVDINEDLLGKLRGGAPNAPQPPMEE